MNILRKIMEILILLIIWASILYIVRLKKDLNIYRKYLSQHDDIYVPSYKEITANNHWTIQLAKYISLQLKDIKFPKEKLIIPIFRKNVTDIVSVQVPKKQF
jgi:hypothetical protein